MRAAELERLAETARRAAAREPDRRDERAHQRSWRWWWAERRGGRAGAPAGELHDGDLVDLEIFLNPALGSSHS